MTKNNPAEGPAEPSKSSPKAEGDSAQEQKPRRHRTMEEWQAMVNDRLDEAIKRGDFDSLPGKGKPLNFNDNPNEPSDMRMANRLLKNNELSPAWIGDRRALMAESEQLRAEIGRQWTWHYNAYTGEKTADRQAEIAASWAATIGRWEEQITEINRRILDFNLTNPIWRLELLRFNLDRELRNIGARRQLSGTQ